MKCDCEFKNRQLIQEKQVFLLPETLKNRYFWENKIDV